MVSKQHQQQDRETVTLQLFWLGKASGAQLKQHLGSDLGAARLSDSSVFPLQFAFIGLPGFKGVGFSPASPHRSTTSWKKEQGLTSAALVLNCVQSKDLRLY